MTEGFEIVRYDHKAMGQTDPDIRFLNQEIADKATAFHSSFPQYQPTPLRRQKCLAQQLGVGEIYVKDESYRFGLNAFKVLAVRLPLDATSHSAWAEIFRSCPFR